jgi:hypothetical protein
LGLHIAWCQEVWWIRYLGRKIKLRIIIDDRKIECLHRRQEISLLFFRSHSYRWLHGCIIVARTSHPKEIESLNELDVMDNKGPLKEIAMTQ